MKLLEELGRRSGGADKVSADFDAGGDAKGGLGVGLCQTRTMPNIFGGYDEYRNGTRISSSHPNIFGGFDKNVFVFERDDRGDFGHPESALAHVLMRHDEPDKR